MSTWTPLSHTTAVLAAAEEWKQRCLIKDGSAFADQELWNENNLSELRRLFVDNPIEDDRSFYDKLHVQLDGAEGPIWQLAAETFWLLLLFVHESSFGVATKRDRISNIWEFSGEQGLPDSVLLKDEAMRGLAKPGTSFLTRIWAEYAYLLTAMHAWKQLPELERTRLIEDNPWLFCDWVTRIEGGDVRAFRHMLIYFCYPEHFERACSRNHKLRIHGKFADRLGEQEDPYIADRTPCGLDKSIYQIRKKLEEEFETSELDFYDEPLRVLWLDDQKAEQEDEDSISNATADYAATAIRYWVEKTNVSGRRDREEGDHRLGRALWSPQRSNARSDIYANMRRVSEGDVVFHLTDNKAITGVSIVADSVDDTFEGLDETEWGNQPSYRVPLRDYVELDPPLLRDAFLDHPEIKLGLIALLQSEAGKNLFYNKNLELNQGAYLTEAPIELVELLDLAYRASEDHQLPYIDVKEGHAQTMRPYGLEDALEELFMDIEEAQQIHDIWKTKKNIILQGPPGVGKSFSALRLAYALIGKEAREQASIVQFHQSYSYEDFIQGYRPTKDGFELKNGRFFEFCRLASDQPNEKFVFVIDEINRGNLSRIFGELMLLIESDKRGEKWAVPLLYGESDEVFFVPENVYLLGLMNTADRSLAVVDYALRRRFAFIDLRPKLESEKFKSHLASNGISERIINLIRQQMGDLNREIEGDQANLGKGFSIGHSFFCVDRGENFSSAKWYRQIIETEVMPLLEEYWFDNTTRVETWRGRLLAGV